MLKKQYSIIKINYWIIVTIAKIATRKIENVLSKKKKTPLSDQCLISNIVYGGSIKCDHREQYYFGSTEAEWKQRFYNHKTRVTKSTETMQKKDSEGSQPNTSWAVVARAKSYNSKWVVIFAF